MRKEKEITVEAALAKAAALCSSSERCTSQIREKLRAWGVSDDDADDIVRRLVEERFIDNARFARAYCHDAFRYNHWGRVRIRQMLCRLHLSDDEIAEGMTAIPEEAYREALSKALHAKDRTSDDTDAFRRKGKLIRHLLSRGFETELVLDILDRAERDA